MTGAPAVRARWRWIGGGVLLTAMVLACPPAGSPAPLTATQLAALELTTYPEGTMAPAFGLGALAGGSVSLAGLRGQVVILNFWATWCRECLEEMPALEALHRRFGARGLAVVGVNVRERAAAVRAYAEQRAVTFPLLLDLDGAVTARYGVLGLPTTFLVGRHGQAVGLAVGPRAWTGPPALGVVEGLLAGR